LATWLVRRFAAVMSTLKTAKVDEIERVALGQRGRDPSGLI